MLLQRSRMLFDKLGIFGFCTLAIVIFAIIYTSAERPHSINEWIFSFNFYGIILQIIGVVFGTYTFRSKLTSGFTTEKKETKYNPVAAAISVLLILFGLWLQLLGLVFGKIGS